MLQTRISGISKYKEHLVRGRFITDVKVNIQIKIQRITRRNCFSREISITFAPTARDAAVVRDGTYYETGNTALTTRVTETNIHYRPCSINWTNIVHY